MYLIIWIRPSSLNTFEFWLFNWLKNRIIILINKQWRESLSPFRPMSVDPISTHCALNSKTFQGPHDIFHRQTSLYLRRSWRRIVASLAVRSHPLDKPRQSAEPRAHLDLRLLFCVAMKTALGEETARPLKAAAAGGWNLVLHIGCSVAHNSEMHTVSVLSQGSDRIDICNTHMVLT